MLYGIKRGCIGKKAFPTAEMAQRQVDYYPVQQAKDSYKCTVCDLFHVGHSREREEELVATWILSHQSTQITHAQ